MPATSWIISTRKRIFLLRFRHLLMSDSFVAYAKENPVELLSDLSGGNVSWRSVSWISARS